jgi:hypothetical protein
MCRIIWAATAKNCARLPFDADHVHTPQVDLMDKRGGMHCIAPGFVFHIAAGHKPQFWIDLLREPGQCGFIAGAPSSQEICNFRRAFVDRAPVPRWHQQIYENRGRIGEALPPVPVGGEQEFGMTSSLNGESL